MLFYVCGRKVEWSAKLAGSWGELSGARTLITFLLHPQFFRFDIVQDIVADQMPDNLP